MTDLPSLTPDGSTFEVLPYTYTNGIFSGRYRGRVLDDVQDFEERINFHMPAWQKRPPAALLRLLALTTALSYYKATRADVFAVHFPISGAERHFLRTLLANGLGEYAYTNDALWKLTPTIEAEELQIGELWSDTFDIHAVPLVAVGGGKDSVASIEALKTAGYRPILYSVNDRGSIRASVAAAGLDYHMISRTVDQRLLAANRVGAPNGHVPVTAINSVLGLITAELLNAGPVIFSNEASAEYGNLIWHGLEVNHQWSKSLAYEDLLRTTLQAVGLDGNRFFSLLRGYREAEITRFFARHEQYFDSFTSCNRAYRTTAIGQHPSWCCACAKCAFVFLLLSPYLPRVRLTQIFGHDMLDLESALPYMVEVLGGAAHKPFECVGEPIEAQEALAATDRQGQWADAVLMPQLRPLLTGVRRTDSTYVMQADRVPPQYQAARNLVGGDG